MIKQLSLKNFKAFPRADINFSKLTIIAGQNSSGKSSVIQCINSILQSTPGRSFPFDLVLNGDRAHMGGFKNVVHGHNGQNSFGIAVKFENDNGSRFEMAGTFKGSIEEGHLFPRKSSIKSDGLELLDIEWNQKKKAFHVRLNPSEDIIDSEVSGISEGLRKILSDPSEARFEVISKSLGTTDPENASSAMRQLFQSVAEAHRVGISYEVGDFSELLALLSKVTFFDSIKRKAADGLGQLRKGCSYVGPIRATPSRYYPLAGSDVSGDNSGEGMSRILARWKDRRTSLIADVKAALSQLELASDISAIVEHDEFLKVLVKPHGRSYSDSLADVGFGLSQVLPIIVADLNLPKNGTLMVNQPEIHLHPSSQALLANYFADRIGNRQYIVETHSEYLINRLRLLVVKKAISAADVNVIYCGTDEKGVSKIYDIGLDADGGLNGAPPEFFATYAADSFGIAMAVLEDEGDA